MAWTESPCLCLKMSSCYPDSAFRIMEAFVAILGMKVYHVLEYRARSLDFENNVLVLILWLI